VGCSFNEYINHLRIEKAKALLLRPELALAQISSIVGYENRSYFGKIFKAKTGTTPAKYRQYHK
ncbi:MAG: helix-turn-helix transcriptional regulator, partial [Clostridia bacterium]|nr:helix-turn-helix transcriptional regulator [Clostridia bacterium]